MTKASSPFSRFLVAALFGFACGVASFGLTERSIIDPRPLYEDPFRLARDEDHPYEITEGHPFSLAGYAFGDFDALAEVELPEGGEMDVVFRQVEPRLRDDGSMPKFHARFSLFRLSATQEGPFYRSREEALFEDELEGGQVLAPGVVASVFLEARGRMFRANVAGVQHPWYETIDDRGGISMVVRGGVGLLRTFDLTPPGRGGGLGWLWAGIAAGLAAAFMTRFRRGLLPVLAATALMPLAAWLGASFVLSLLLPEVWPTESTVIGFALAGLPMSILLAWRLGPVSMAISVLALAATWYACLSQEGEQRLRYSEDPRLEEYFGPDSGLAPMDALSRRLHAKARVHRLAKDLTRVFFLGGGDLFEPWARNEGRSVAYLPLQVQAEVGSELGKEIEAVVMPGDAVRGEQHLRLLRRFYLEDYKPQALVFAIAKATIQDRVDSALGLGELLDDLAELADTADLKVIILRSEMLPAEQADLLPGYCAGRGWPLVSGLLGAEPSERLVSELSTQLVELLR